MVSEDILEPIVVQLRKFYQDVSLPEDEIQDQINRHLDKIHRNLFDADAVRILDVKVYGVKSATDFKLRIDFMDGNANRKHIWLNAGNGKTNMTRDIKEAHNYKDAMIEHDAVHGRTQKAIMDFAVGKADIEDVLKVVRQDKTRNSAIHRVNEQALHYGSRHIQDWGTWEKLIELKAKIAALPDPYMKESRYVAPIKYGTMKKTVQEGNYSLDELNDIREKVFVYIRRWSRSTDDDATVLVHVYRVGGKLNVEFLKGTDDVVSADRRDSSRTALLGIGPNMSGDDIQGELDSVMHQLKHQGVRESVQVEEATSKIPHYLWDIGQHKKASENIQYILTGSVPVLYVGTSDLGGDERATVFIHGSLDDKKTWYNGIFQNSRYFIFAIDRNGEIKLIAKHHKLEDAKFRKTRVKSIHDVAGKIAAWIEVAKHTKGMIKESSSNQSTNRRVPAELDKWSMFAGGIGAPYGRNKETTNSYSYSTIHGKYTIDAVNRRGRVNGWHLRFANLPNREAGGKFLGQGLWYNLGIHGSARIAAEAAEFHHNGIATFDSVEESTEVKESLGYRIKPTDLRAIEQFVRGQVVTPGKNLYVDGDTLRSMNGVVATRDRNGFVTPGEAYGNVSQTWVNAVRRYAERVGAYRSRRGVGESVVKEATVFQNAVPLDKLAEYLAFYDQSPTLNWTQTSANLTDLCQACITMVDVGSWLSNWLKDKIDTAPSEAKTLKFQGVLGTLDNALKEVGETGIGNSTDLSTNLMGFNKTPVKMIIQNALLAAPGEQRDVARKYLETIAAGISNIETVLQEVHDSLNVAKEERLPVFQAVGAEQAINKIRSYVN